MLERLEIVGATPVQRPDNAKMGLFNAGATGVQRPGNAGATLVQLPLLPTEGEGAPWGAPPSSGKGWRHIGALAAAMVADLVPMPPGSGKGPQRGLPSAFALCGAGEVLE